MLRLYFFLFWLTLNPFDTKANQHIQVVTEDWPPYNYRLPNGEIGGESTRLVKLVLDLSGIHYDIRLYPWMRSLDIAKTQPNTLIYSILRTPERESHFKWICPISKPIAIYLYALRKRKDIQVKQLNDAKAYLTGVTRGDYPHIRLSQLGFADKSLHISSAELSNVKMLLSGRVDFVVQTHNSTEMVLAQLDLPMSIVKPILEVNSDNASANCMAFNPQTKDEIVNKVRRALQSINQAQNKRR